MSLCRCNFYSAVLSTCVNVQVFIPSPSRDHSGETPLASLYAPREKFPVLYLLHGMYEDDSVWVRRTNIERYAQKRSIAVVMPSAQNSYYTDMAHGLDYFTFLTEELPLWTKSLFPVSDRREDTFIAGLSMGGYGACKAALKKSEQYAAFASLSGAVDITMIAKYAATDREKRMFEDVFGSFEVENGPDDLRQIARLAAQKGLLPRAYLACGTDDVLCYPMNENLRTWLSDAGIPYTYEEGPGGHEWDFWDLYIQRALDWMAKRP